VTARKEKLTTIRGARACFIGTRRIAGRVVSESTLGQGSRGVFVGPVLPHRLISALSEGQLRGAILGYESAFSHLANVLRVITLRRGSKGAYVLGVGELWKAIARGKQCVVFPAERRVDVDSMSYRLPSRGRYIADDVAIRAGQPDLVCYKPFYFYATELAQLVARGYEVLAQTILHCECKTTVDDCGQVWVQGIGLPVSLANWALANRDEFLERVEEYAEVLKRMLVWPGSAENPSGEGSVELRKVLVTHYSYSPLVTFPVARLAELLGQHSYPQRDFDDLARFIAQIAPTANDRITVAAALEYAICLVRYVRQARKKSKLSYLDLALPGSLKIGRNILRTSISDLLLLTGVYSEVRRSVVSALRRSSPWFQRITRHRERIDIPSTENWGAA
jgi:hypothetical protein